MSIATDGGARRRARVSWDCATRTAVFHIDADVIYRCWDHNIVVAMSRYLRDKPVEILEVHFCNGNEVGTIVYIESYEAVLLLPTLREIYITGDKPLRDDCSWIDRVLLPGNRLLRAVSISASNFLPPLYTLSRFLASSTCLRHLNLYKFVLREDDVALLCAALRGNTTLSFLAVRWWPGTIGSADAVAAIADLVAHNRTLRTLCMKPKVVFTPCLVWDRAALHALAAALADNTTLQVFGFYYTIADAIAIMQHNAHTKLSGEIASFVDLPPDVAKEMSSVYDTMAALQSAVTLRAERDAAIASLLRADEVRALLLANERAGCDAALPAHAIEHIVAEIGASVIEEYVSMERLQAVKHAASPMETPYPRCAVM